MFRNLMVLTLTLCFSCTDDQNIIPDFKSVKGKIELYNIYDSVIYEYEDVFVDLLWENEIIATAIINEDGTFEFDLDTEGTYLITVRKEGYSGYDTIRINSDSNINELSPIVFVENLPLSIKLDSFYYHAGEFYHNVQMEYLDHRTFYAGNEFFFSKSSDVSYKNHIYRWCSSNYGYCTDNHFRDNIGGTTYPFDLLANFGFASGDTIYVVGHTISSLFNTLYYPNNNILTYPYINDLNFAIVSHRRDTPSNVFSFILE